MFPIVNSIGIWIPDAPSRRGHRGGNNCRPLRRCVCMLLLVWMAAPAGNPSRVVRIVGVVVECVWWRWSMLRRLVVFVQASHAPPVPAAAAAAAFDRSVSPSIGRMLLMLLVLMRMVRLLVLRMVRQMRRNRLVGRWFQPMMLLGEWLWFVVAIRSAEYTVHKTIGFAVVKQLFRKHLSEGRHGSSIPVFDLVIVLVGKQQREKLGELPKKERNGMYKTEQVSASAGASAGAGDSSCTYMCIFFSIVLSSLISKGKEKSNMTLVRSRDMSHWITADWFVLTTIKGSGIFSSGAPRDGCDGCCNCCDDDDDFSRCWFR